MKQAYIDRRFSPGSLAIIERADSICAEYADQGFDLTLRQLYYQFVARGFLPNRQSEYKRLGSIVNDARLAGLLDWSAIVDRTRDLETLPTWNSPAHIIRDDAQVFLFDAWEDQPTRVEVWIEKDALTGVIEPVCRRNQVPYLSCRGYTSQSEVWGASQRIGGYLDGAAEGVVILHLGDHDPSGLDMTRDIEDRLKLFLEGDGHDPAALTIDRIALNMDQVQRLNPPPNPAKMTDSRSAGYVKRFGRTSWELDALDPRTLDALIQGEIEGNRDPDLWSVQVSRRDDARRLLALAGRRWNDVVAYLESAA